MGCALTAQPTVILLQEHDLINYPLLGSRAAGVHRSDPFELVAGLEVFGHAFCFGELGGDEVDLLTSYNLQTISYDAMGNPTSYLGATLTWQGKKLTGYSKGNTAVSYIYNEDGLRLKKTVNNTDTNYYYNGSVLMAMTGGYGGSIYQRFSYDARGKVVAVDYSNDSGNTYTTYYYLRNAQGDIVKLIDGSGSTVVEYVYDSWGKVLSTTGTLASTLGQNQPFRYRGYVYDEETQWYYLQSRYYDPAVRRFISADVYLSTGQGVLGHNSFAYCGNNPISRYDSNGLSYVDYFEENSSYGAAGTIAAGGMIWGLIVGLFSKIFDKTETLTIADVKTEDIPREQAYFPINPYTFKPRGLQMVPYPGTTNGAVIKWFDPQTMIAVFEWDEDYKYGMHYHILNPDGSRVGDFHFLPLTPVPEPWNTVYFGGY